MAAGSPFGKESSEPSVVPKLLRVQLAIGIIAFVLCVMTAVSLVPLFTERTKLQKEVEDLKQQVADGTNMLRQAHKISPVEGKELAVAFPAQARVLNEILRLQRENPTWKLGGRSPQEGFDSPSFAIYILRHNGLLPAGSSKKLEEDSEGEQAALSKVLASADKPEVGDIAFYEKGYTMFYYRDHEGHEFVIGMTPLGIASLEPEFAQLTKKKYGSVTYHGP